MGEPATTVATDSLSERAFLDHILKELRTGQQQLVVRFTDDDLEAIEEEWVGEHFSRYPFLY
jgi:hypothetical protein